MSERERGGHPEVARLSAYMEGDLGRDEHDEVKAHLGDCGRCRRVLDELETVVARVRALEDVPPIRDLWPEVADAVTASASDPGDPVVDPAVGRWERRSGARRYRFSAPQLAAAAAALMFLSGAGAWLAHPGVSGDGAVRPGEGASTDAPVRAAPFREPGAPEEYRSELVELQRLLRERRDELAPNTVRVLEKNLAVIDRAIRESREALGTDPGNPYLESHLDRAYRTKLEYLRETARIVRWSSGA